MIFNHVSDDYNRVVLEPDGDGYDEGDYINASYVDVSATDAMQIYIIQRSALHLHVY